MSKIEYTKAYDYFKAKNTVGDLISKTPFDYFVMVWNMP